MTSYPEYIHTSVAKKLWFPYGNAKYHSVKWPTGGSHTWEFHRAFRWPPPRLSQIMQLVKCYLHGHKWTEWVTDDWEGPMMWDEFGGHYPMTSRYAEPWEAATRSCANGCGTYQNRVPAYTISEA